MTTIKNTRNGLVDKILVYVPNSNFKILEVEANKRGIKVSALVRAVIIPDWFKRKQKEVR